jgi:putative membrane protein
MVRDISDADHARVSAAIAEAEKTSDGEIIAVTTELSDKYHDVALHWAVLVLIATIAIFAAFPEVLHFWFEWFDFFFGGWWPEPSLGELLTLLLVLSVAKFTIALLVLRYMPLRLALTPRATKARRVRRRAIELFRTAAERRTVGQTGILIYLSMGEHRAEIIGDEAITKVTTSDTWAEAMEALLAEAKARRYADGIIAAVERVGTVLSEHFPKSAGNPNEIPDKLIEL